MAQDLSVSKANFAAGAQAIAARILALARDCDEFSAQYFAHGFDITNVFVQTDLVGTNAHLTPAIIVGVITQVQAVTTAMSVGARNVLRTALNTQGTN